MDDTTTQPTTGSSEATTLTVTSADPVGPESLEEPVQPDNS